ncbi:EcsC family protein [Pendulispora brunnea]|uniref:EcsC family protein n=1 Tax=Pendulispora brunnea TaxID=2905690 RepID=A0ABZ2K8K6_9BACT
MNSSHDFPPPSGSQLTPYEQSALDDVVAESLSPYRTPISTLVHVLNGPVASEAEPDMMARGIWRFLAAATDLASRTVPSERLRELRRLAMRPMRSVADIARLDLWEVDETARWLESKYAIMGALLGVGTAAFGLRGLMVGKPLVTWLAMRQISEYGRRYGFDLSDPHERTFATQIFVASLCPRLLPRDAAPDHLSAVTNAAKRVSRFAGVLDMVRGVVRKVMRSKKVRASPVIVAVGAAVYSAWFMRGVARTAAIAYRERFIARKHHVPVAALEPFEQMPPTMPSRSEAYPPAPYGRSDEARPASARVGVVR